MLLVCATASCHVRYCWTGLHELCFPLVPPPEAVTTAPHAAYLRITLSDSGKSFLEMTLFGHGRLRLAFMYIMLLLLQYS